MQESLGSYWRRKTSVNTNSDRLVIYSDRIRADIQKAIQCGQTQVCVFQLHVTIRELQKELLSGCRTPELWFDVKAIVKTFRPFFNLDDDSCSGFKLHDRFLPLLLWIRQEGLDYYLTDQLQLFVHWNSATADSMQTKNTLFHQFMSSTMKPIENTDFDGIRNRIKLAMDSGQTSSYVCHLYSPKDFKKKEEEGTYDSLFVYKDWFVCEPSHVLIKTFVVTEKLYWRLDDVFEDVALFVVYWT